MRTDQAQILQTSSDRFTSSKSVKIQAVDHSWSHRLILRLAASIRKPRRVLKPTGNHSARVHTVKHGGETMMVSEAYQGRIHTDTANNISVLQRIRSSTTIPDPLGFSGSTTISKRSQTLRFLLSGKIRLHEPPLRLKGTMISLLNGQTRRYNYDHWLYNCLAKIKLFEAYLQDLKDATSVVLSGRFSFQRQTLKMRRFPCLLPPG
jgi:hypothetical protein